VWELCETVCGFAKTCERVLCVHRSGSHTRGAATDASRVDSERMVVTTHTRISETNGGMQIKTILNRIQKQRGFVYGAVQVEEQIGSLALTIDIAPHRRNRPRCSGCGESGRVYDRLTPRRFEFVPVETGRTARMALNLIALDRPTEAFAGVFTRNAFPGAPVIVGRRRMEGARLGAVVVNSKISNVCAPGGVAAVESLCAAAASRLGLVPEEVLTALGATRSHGVCTRLGPCPLCYRAVAMSELPHRDPVGMAKESDAVVEREALTGADFGSDGFKTRHGPSRRKPENHRVRPAFRW